VKTWGLRTWENIQVTGQENWPELTLKYNFKTRFSPTGRSGAGTGPGWRKNIRRKNPVWPGDLANPVKNSVATRWVLFFTKTMSFWFFFLKKSWPGRSDDPVKTQNLSLGPDQPLGVIIFGLVRFLSKKSNQTKKILKKPKSVQTETGSNQPISVRFSFFGQKPVQTGLARFFLVFSVWVRFGSVFSVSVL